MQIAIPKKLHQLYYSIIFIWRWMGTKNLQIHPVNDRNSKIPSYNSWLILVWWLENCKLRLQILLFLAWVNSAHLSAFNWYQGCPILTNTYQNMAFETCHMPTKFSAICRSNRAAIALQRGRSGIILCMCCWLTVLSTLFAVHSEQRDILVWVFCQTQNVVKNSFIRYDSITWCVKWSEKRIKIAGTP